MNIYTWETSSSVGRSSGIVLATNQAEADMHAYADCGAESLGPIVHKDPGLFVFNNSNLDAYTAGDIKLFFADPRTRTEYAEWAPLLMLAEDCKAGKYVEVNGQFVKRHSLDVVHAVKERWQDCGFRTCRASPGFTCAFRATRYAFIGGATVEFRERKRWVEFIKAVASAQVGKMVIIPKNECLHASKAEKELMEWLREG